MDQEARQPSSIGLLARGACMGVADVIPGVSGGTMALILGIYRPLLEAVRSVRLDLPVLALRALAGGLSTEARRPLIDALREIHWRFIIPLAIGIACAFVVGSKIIPDLMRDHPAEMRGLFFGLILASIVVPLGLLERRSAQGLVAALLLGAAAAAAGYALTDPTAHHDLTTEWIAYEVPSGEPLTFKDVLRRGPAGQTAAQVFWDAKNRALQDALRADRPAEIDALERERSATALIDKDALKQQSQAYEELPVPAGLVVHMPRPAMHYVFLAGAIAICAMVLPGISGSFLLLVMGLYFFMFKYALRGALAQLAQGVFPAAALTYIALFGVGMILGLALFTRLLAWMLARYHDPTMGALVGLMIGCLRGVWPWRDAGVNAMPADLGVATPALAAALVGIAVVVALQFADRRLRGGSDGEARSTT